MYQKILNYNSYTFGLLFYDLYGVKWGLRLWSSFYPFLNCVKNDCGSNDVSFHAIRLIVKAN